MESNSAHLSVSELYLSNKCLLKKRTASLLVAIYMKYPSLYFKHFFLWIHIKLWTVGGARRCTWHIPGPAFSYFRQLVLAVLVSLCDCSVLNRVVFFSVYVDDSMLWMGPHGIMSHIATLQARLLLLWLVLRKAVEALGATVTTNHEIEPEETWSHCIEVSEEEAQIICA